MVAAAKIPPKMPQRRTKKSEKVSFDIVKCALMGVIDTFHTSVGSILVIISYFMDL